MSASVCIGCNRTRSCLRFTCRAPNGRVSELAACVDCLRDPVQQRAVTVALAEDAAAIVLVDPVPA